MIASHAYKPETRWDQTAFEKLRATWSPERIARDEKTLQKIFALAADCPLLAEELEWAEQHGIKFFVDHQAVKTGGYYNPGTGVLAITPGMTKNPESAVLVLAHELRHAWQDYRHLVSSTSDKFTDNLIKRALMEADAYAYGMAAMRQYQMACLEKRRWAIGKKWRLSRLGKDTDFGKHFLNWFSRQSSLQFYGDIQSQSLGRFYGLLSAEKIKLNCELSAKSGQIVPASGININNIQDVLRLGVDFSGTKNYLAVLPPDILPTKILRPWLANIFWGAANKKQRKLTTELRKTYLKRKLAPEDRKKHHPWP